MDSSSSLECLGVKKLLIYRTLIHHTVEELAELSPEFLVSCAAKSIYLVYDKLPQSVQSSAIVKECLRCDKHYPVHDCWDGPMPMIKDCYGCRKV